MDAQQPARLVTLGQVVGVHGVRGGIKIISHTRPRTNIFSYRQWWLQRSDESWSPYELHGGQPQGKGLVAELNGVADRDTARSLMGAAIAVDRSVLPPLPAGEYYWCDLIGLAVCREDGSLIGRVRALEETGANDVLVVATAAGSEQLIPYVPDHTVLAVDLDNGRLTVDWPEETD